MVRQYFNSLSKEQIERLYDTFRLDFDLLNYKIDFIDPVTDNVTVNQE